QAGQLHDSARDTKGEERNDGGQGVRQNVLGDDRPVVHAHGTRCLDIVEVAGAQEFGTHIGTQTHPAKDAEKDNEQGNTGLKGGRENYQEIQFGERTPDLDAALPQQVEPAPEKALYSPNKDPEYRP